MSELLLLTSSLLKYKNLQKEKTVQHLAFYKNIYLKKMIRNFPLQVLILDFSMYVF